jgi:hypothetical protein
MTNSMDGWDPRRNGIDTVALRRPVADPWVLAVVATPSK